MRSRHLKTAAAILLLNSFFSCSDKEPSLEGTWDSVGYGKQMVVTDSIVTLYDTYSGGCALFAELPRNVFDDISETVSLTGDSLEIKVGMTVYVFTRKGPDAANCSDRLSGDNPLSNFDALWNTFNENYSSFDLRGIDWDKMREHYRPMLTEQSSDKELYSVLIQMISELNDGHVFLEAPDSLKNDSVGSTYDQALRLRKSVISGISSTYLDEINEYDKGNVVWGTIDGSIGYIQINDFEDLADYGISDSLSGAEFWEAYREAADSSPDYTTDVLAGLNRLMEVITGDLKYTECCIIDVRFNSGGFDKAGLDVLSFFTDHRTVAYTKKARSGNGYTGKQTFYLESRPGNYTNPVYILTSFQTASAAETFVLASKNLPRVQRIGSHTEGVFSDVLTKRLPNGWEYGLSNEIYESPDGTSYEMYGIGPDFPIAYEKGANGFYTKLMEELRTGDIALDKAIGLCKGQ